MENKNNNSSSYLLAGLVALFTLFAVLLFWLIKLDRKSTANVTAQKGTVTPVPTRAASTPTPTINISPIVSPTPSAKAAVTLTPSVSPSGSITPSVKPSSSTAKTQVKVFFSQTPKSAADPTYAVWKGRATQRADQANFVIEQLIAGPTSQEMTAGLFSPLKFTGDSNCNGQDFTLTTDETKKTATIKFCRTIDASTVTETKQVKSLIYFGLTQFNKIEKVVILTSADHCLGDTTDSCKLNK